MAEDLQGLLNKIRDDGFKKAEEEKTSIITEANETASRIIADAETQAQSIVAEAEAEAKSSAERAAVTIRQSARDITLSLKASIEARLRELVKTSAGQAMTPEYMAKIITLLASANAKDASSGIEAVLPASELETLKNALLSSLTADLKVKTTLEAGSGFASGIKVGFRDSDIYLDFSDEALADMICDFAGPKISAIVKG